MIEWLSSLELSPGWAALLGAILGSTATHFWHEWRERKQRLRELSGIIRLLDKEMEHHQKRLNLLTKGKFFVGTKQPYDFVPATSVWDEVSVRLAQLLKDDDLFAGLVEYYEEAHDLAKFVQDSSAPAQSVIERMSIRAKRLIDLSKNIRPRLQKLIGKNQRWWQRWFGG